MTQRDEVLASMPGRMHEDSYVKVIDFGVAKALVEKPDAMGLTHGGFVGTPAFASPEQFTDAQVEVRSDIYSLGATLWYLLTGNRPFQGATIEQIRASQRSRALPIEQLKAARVPSQSHVTAGVDACPRTSRAAECPCTHVAIAELPRTDSRPLESGAPIGYCGWFDRDRRCRLRAVPPVARSSRLCRTRRLQTSRRRALRFYRFATSPKTRTMRFSLMAFQEELLNLLTKVPQLQVAARTSSFSFKGKQIEIPEIARKLHVANVLEGSVRKSGDQLRITAQLVRAAEGYHLWSETYDRKLDDIFKIQDEIAGEVVKQLKVTLLGAKPTVRETDPKAYTLYLQACAAWTAGTLPRRLRSLMHF